MLGNETNMTSVNPMLEIYETVIASILTILTVSSCVSNLVMIIVFIKFKCLRTKHDMLVINLAFTNLFITFGISCYLTYTLNPGHLLHIKLICLLIFICIFGGILSSLLVLLYLALERYICIIHPVFHSRIKLCHVALFSLLAHSIGIIYAVIPFVLKNNWKEYLVCVANVYPFEFSVAEHIFGVIIMVAIIIINAIVFKTALSHASKINTLLRNVQNKHKSKRKFRQKGKAFVTVFLISGVSVVCWIPLLIVFRLESNPNLNENLRWIFTQILYIPVSLNSSVTAIIIGYRNRHFKDAIKSMCSKKKHECNRNGVY